MPPIITRDKCISCGECVDICPTDVIHFTEGDDIPEITYPEECWHCNSCVLDCPEDAVTLRLPLPAMLLYREAPQK